jgi:hypothetical protein
LFGNELWIYMLLLILQRTQWGYSDTWQWFFSTRQIRQIKTFADIFRSTMCNFKKSWWYFHHYTVIMHCVILGLELSANVMTQHCITGSLNSWLSPSKSRYLCWSIVGEIHNVYWSIYWPWQSYLYINDIIMSYYEWFVRWGVMDFYIQLDNTQPITSAECGSTKQR